MPTLSVKQLETLRVMAKGVVVAVTNGRPGFGPCQRVFVASRDSWPVSLDGRARKRVLVKLIGGVDASGESEGEAGTNGPARSTPAALSAGARVIRRQSARLVMVPTDGVLDAESGGDSERCL